MLTAPLSGTGELKEKLPEGRIYRVLVGMPGGTEIENLQFVLQLPGAHGSQRSSRKQDRYPYNAAFKDYRGRSRRIGPFQALALRVVTLLQILISQTDG